MDISYSRFAGLCGIAAGVCGFLYLIAFVVTGNPGAFVPSLLLLLLGLLGPVVIIALYRRVRDVDAGFALWGLVLTLAGALGAAVHGAYDVALNLHPSPSAFTGISAIDPRGFLTFGVAGLGATVISWLLSRGTVFPRMVANLGMLSGILLIALYVAYLVIFDATNPLVIALVFASGILQPAWYLWLGWLLWQETAAR